MMHGQNRIKFMCLGCLIMNSYSRLLCDAAVLLCFCVILKGHLYLVRQMARDVYVYNIWNFHNDSKW